MTGSGTVLAVARDKGHRAFGVDLDPLAVLLAGVWTRTVDPKPMQDKAAEVLSHARSDFKSLTSGSAYPAASDEETREFMRFWFDDYARKQLAALSERIFRVRDVATREVLWCGFSRLIITKSAGASLAMDLSHSRPHKEFEYAPVKPFNRFISAVETVVSNCPQAGAKLVGPAAVVKHGDARKLDIEDGSIDLVLTSPPYLNAIDYMRCSKFSLVWMGYTMSQIRDIRGSSIGAEISSEEAMSAPWVKLLIKQLKLKLALSNRDHAILVRYVWDMGHALAEVSRVLRSGGRAVYVVGDSTIKGTFISNSSIVSAVAQSHGLSLVSSQSRALPANRRYLPPPKKGISSQAMDTRMRREVIVEFSKP
ncbi:MAG: hypothetical protein MOGMAGMI_00789 [Candidatus Omnitrophica bacterium]|nr:hypothetical protein [Candidatus Omnitrophota bacterium]